MRAAVAVQDRLSAPACALIPSAGPAPSVPGPGDPPAAPAEMFAAYRAAAGRDTADTALRKAGSWVTP
ncbi:hypothetical protein ACIGW5_32840 [Streptomyces prasinus]|uniref:hypothetical protein n=1 Tax=Streptomyces prasinus TaxID=67345 RepID=UPI0037CD3C8E